MDIGAVDALARLQLTLRRAGCELRLLELPQELEQLIELAGLTAVLGVELRREAEEREEPLDVEERGHRGDLPA